MKKLIILAIALLVAVPAYAEGVNSGPSDKVREMYKAQQEATREKFQMMKEGRSLRIEGLKERKASTTEEFRVRWEENKLRREEKRKEIAEKFSEKMAASFEKMFERFAAVAERLGVHAEKISEQIIKMEEKGGDLSVAKEKLVSAEAKIEALPGILSEIEESVSAKLSAPEPKENREAIKADIKKAKDAIRETQESLVEVLREIKAKNSNRGERKATSTPIQ